MLRFFFSFFFFNDTATTEIYTLSLHDALPISRRSRGSRVAERRLDHARGDQPGRNGSAVRSAVRSVARRRRQPDRGGRAHGAHRFRGERDDRLAVLGAAAGARAPCPGPARTAGARVRGGDPAPTAQRGRPGAATPAARGAALFEPAPPARVPRAPAG